MKGIIEAIRSVEYNAYKAICVIEGDVDLSEIFQGTINLEYNLLKTMAGQDALPPHVEDFLSNIFNKIILTKKELINAYTAVQVEQPKPAPKVEVPVKLHDKVPDKRTEAPVKAAQTKKETKLPRRYGKDAIQALVKKEGRKPTEAERAMLAVNDLRNIYVNLSNRLIKTLLSDHKVVSEMEARDIIAIVDTVKKKMKGVLSKK